MNIKMYHYIFLQRLLLFTGIFASIYRMLFKASGNLYQRLPFIHRFIHKLSTERSEDYDVFRSSVGDA